MEKGDKSEVMRKIMLMMLESSGMNIVPPQEVIVSFKEKLNLTNEDTDVLLELNDVPEDKKTAVLKSACMHFLTIRQLMDLSDFLREEVIPAVLDYGKTHPEVRKEVNVEDMLGDILGED